MYLFQARAVNAGCPTGRHNEMSPAAASHLVIGTARHQHEPNHANHTNELATTAGRGSNGARHRAPEHHHVSVARAGPAFS